MFLLVALVATLVNATRGDTDEDRRDRIVDLARDVSLGITAYDYRDMEQTRDRVLSQALPSFEGEYEQVLGAGVTQALTANQAVATSKITVGPMVASERDHEARTFTVVEQKVETAAQAKENTQRLRVEVTMVETPDGWRASGIEVT